VDTVAARIIHRKKEMGENIVGEFHEGTKTKRHKALDRR
jgi:hypothetical protein